MKFSVELAALSDALPIVARAVAGKGIRPILANLLVNVGTDEIRLVGTDMEVMVISRIKAQVEVGGHFTIPARLMTDIVSSLPTMPEGTAIRFETMESSEGSIQIFCGRHKFNLQIQGIEEFPPIPALDGEPFPRFDCSSAMVKKGLKEVYIAMGAEDSNPTQRSICFNFAGEGKVVLVATDSKRLGVTHLPNLPYPPEFQRVFLVPQRAIPEILKLLEVEEKINVGYCLQQLVFTTSRFQLLTRLIDGKFPDYNRVLPKECNRKATVNRRELMQSLKAANPIARHSSSMIHLDIGATEMRIWSESSEEGMSEAFVPVRLEGEPINIAFNVAFLMEFLSVVEEEDVVLEMTTPSYPGVLKPVGPESRFIYVLMPMTL